MMPLKKQKKSIVAINQFSGYLMFQKEIKKNDYFEKSRDFYDSIVDIDKFPTFLTLSIAHDFSKYIKMGRCGEFSDYLNYEINKKLTELKVQASIWSVGSNIKDHGYLHIEIWLENEIKPSLWEVDAWDPRIIDVSMRPNKSIKNQEISKYGKIPEILKKISTDKFKPEPYTDRFFKEFTPPKPGKPKKRSRTPEKEILTKHRKIYKDYTIEKSQKNGFLPPSKDELGYMQKASSWQKK
jgi:hypothetical protein